MSFGFGVGDIITVAQLALDAWQTFKDAPEKFQAISTEFAGLYTVLSLVDSIPWDDISDERKQDVLSLAKGSRDILTDWEKVVKRSGVIGNSANSFGAKAKKVWKRFRFDEQEVVELRTRIISNTTLLNTFTATLASERTHKTLVKIEKGVKALQSKEQRKELQEIAAWLSPLNFSSTHADVRSKWQPGTGEWFLKSPEYLDWLNGKEAALWCPGDPGTGKTVIASTVVEHIRSEIARHSNSETVVFIYFNYTFGNSQSFRNLVGGLIRQLVEQRRLASGTIKSSFQEHSTNSIPVTDREIKSLMSSEIMEFDRIYVILDALDECPEKGDLRFHLLNAIRSLPVDIKLLVTSRKIPSIKKDMIGGRILEIRAAESDLRCYVKGRIDSDRNLMATHVKGNKEYEDRVMEAILRKAKEMFLLAQLHMDSLADKKNLGNLLQALEELPDTIDGTYNEAMMRIEEQPKDSKLLANDVLAWICYAKRQLRVPELQHALALQHTLAAFRTTSEFRREWITEEGVILSVCAGMVVVDTDSNVIRLVHYSAQQYFDKKRSEAFPEAPLKISRVCLAYLSFGVFTKGFCWTEDRFKKRLLDYPFYDYAASNWGAHIREERESILEDPALNFLKDNKKVIASSQIIIKSEYRYAGNYQLSLKGFTGIHLAAFFGLTDLMKKLDKHGVELESTTNFGQTPIFWAAQNGHMDALEWLIEKGVDADRKDTEWISPLLLASQNGHLHAVKRLLEEGASPNGWDTDTTPILAYGVKSGNAAIVGELLDYDANPNPEPDSYGTTPLNIAVEKNYEDISKLLLERGVDPNAKTKNGQDKPLLTAASNGQNATVELLLSHGAKLISASSRGITALSAASRNGHESTVSLLLSKGAKPDAETLFRAAENGHELVVKTLLGKGNGKDEKASTSRALWIAAQNGHVAVVKFLLGTEFDTTATELSSMLALVAKNGHVEILSLLLETHLWLPDQEDHRRRTPLSYAAEEGHEAVVQQLLRAGVQPDSVSDTSRTPLSYAAGRGYLAVAKLLLDLHSNPNSPDGGARTPLSYAAEGGHDAVVKLLLERDAQPWVKDNHDRIPLCFATKKGSEATMALLLEKRTQLDLSDHDIQLLVFTAAQDGHGAAMKLLCEAGTHLDPKVLGADNLVLRAAENGYEVVIRLLVGAGFDVNCRDTKGRSPLSYAAEQGRLAIVQFLLRPETGTTLKDDRDKQGRTPLFHAVESGKNEAIVELLLENGFEVDAKDENWHTPLTRAAISWQDRGRIVEILLENDAEVDSKDQNGRTPLSHAAEHNGVAVVQLLLQYDAEVDSRCNTGRTPLSYTAGRSRFPDVAIILLENGAEVESRDDNGRTPLSYAGKNGTDSLASVLIERGATIDTKDKKGNTPLSWSAENRGPSTTRFLLMQGADPNILDNEGRAQLWTAHPNWRSLLKDMKEQYSKDKSKKDVTPTLIEAVTSKPTTYLRSLLQDNDINPNIKDSKGWTPLAHASRWGRKPIVAALLEDPRVEPDMRNRKSQTPLILAAEHGHYGVVKLLLGNERVDAAAVDGDKWNAISGAAWNNHTRVVQLLLDDNRCDPKLQDKEGSTPLALARRKKNREVALLLSTVVGV